MHCELVVSDHIRDCCGAVIAELSGQRSEVRGIMTEAHQFSIKYRICQLIGKSWKPLLCPILLSHFDFVYVEKGIVLQTHRLYFQQAKIRKKSHNDGLCFSTQLQLCWMMSYTQTHIQLLQPSRLQRLSKSSL